MASRTIHDAVAADAPPELALQKRYGYDANLNVVFEAWAVQGAATSAAVWAVRQSGYTDIGTSPAQYVQTSASWYGDTSDFTHKWSDVAALCAYAEA